MGGRSAELEERAGEAFATLGMRGGATVHVSRRRAPEVWSRLAE